MLLLLLFVGCSQSYDCCVEGKVETCRCPAGAPCAHPVPFVTHDDGTCELATGDTGNSNQ